MQFLRKKFDYFLCINFGKELVLKMSLMSKKNKIFSVLILSAVILICLVTFMPSTAFAEDGTDIIIGKTSIQEFPLVDIYLSFKEGSEMGSQELTSENIKVLENNTQVTRLSIEKVDTITEPIGVVLALDTSGSMKDKPIEDAKSAAILFMDQMRQIDRFAVVGFADEVKIYSQFTSNRDELKKSIAQIEAKGETSLFDGINIGLDQFSKQDIKHRYLIVLSDGKDTISKLKPQDDVDKANRENVTVYSIALASKDYDPTDLNYISQSSGGELLTAANSEQLKELYSAISRKIRNQYKISYTSLWPNSENITVNIDIEKAGIKESASINYVNPFFTPSPTKVVTAAPPAYQNFFSIPWVKMVIYAAIFVGVALLVYAFILLIFRPKQILKDRMGIYSGKQPGALKTETETKEDKSNIKMVSGIVGLVSRVASKRGFAQMFSEKLERADIKMKGSEFITLQLVSLIIIGILVQFIFKNILITAVVFFIILLVPIVIINFKENQRIKKINDQLPDALQLVSGSLKSGYSFNQAISMVIDETKPPLSAEFKMVLNETRMGLAEKEALENMAKRVNSENLTWTVMAINVQREVGGNLAEVMEIIADTTRERDRVMNQIKALTSEGKISAYILIALPVSLSLMLVLLNRSYIATLVTTRIGLVLLLIAGLLMVVGIFWIMRIIRIRY
jgi:tight adherence protein B